MKASVRKKALALLLVLCSLILPASALAGEISALLNLLFQAENDPLRLELSGQVQAYPPFDEQRVNDLNRLLNHVSLDLLLDGDVSDIRLLVDEKETVQLMQKTTEGQTSLWTDLAPATTFCLPAEEWTESGSTLWVEEADVTLAALGRGWLDLSNMYDLLAVWPEIAGERAKESAVRQKVKRMGTATRKVVISCTAEDVAQGAVTEMIQALPHGALQNLLAQLIFEGRQRLVLLFDAEGGLLRVQYGGKAGLNAEDLRSVSLDWKCQHRENQQLDDLALKTPAVTGRNRFNVNLSRTLREAEEGERMTLTFAADRMWEGVRTRFSGEADLSWADSLNGVFSFTRTVGSDQQTVEIRPEGIRNTVGIMKGKLAISRSSSKIKQEDYLLDVQLREGETLTWPTETETAALTAPLAQNSSWAALSEKVAARLLQHLLLVPAEDLDYLLRDLPANVGLMVTENQ